MSDYLPKEYVQRKSLAQLVYKGLDNVKIINKMQYEQVLKSYPILADLYAAVKELYAIIYSKHSYELEPWLAKLEKFNVPELQTYINGIRCDIDAVKKCIDSSTILEQEAVMLYNTINSVIERMFSAQRNYTP